MGKLGNKMITKGGGVIMKQEQWWLQCSVCGHIHKKKMIYDVEDDLYIEEICPRCRGKTRQLVCSEKEDDIYMYYNVNVDPRYY